MIARPQDIYSCHYSILVPTLAPIFLLSLKSRAQHLIPSLKYSLQLNARTVSQLGHGRLLPNPLQFIINQPSSPILCSLCTDGFVTYINSHKNKVKQRRGYFSLVQADRPRHTLSRVLRDSSSASRDSRPLPLQSFSISIIEL
jgi:hypothetical protein